VDSSAIKSFSELSKRLRFENRNVPLKYDRRQCDEALTGLGFTKSPDSYVDYFTHIGYVIWECETDSLGISPPDPRPDRGIRRQMSDLVLCQSTLGLTKEDMTRLVPFGSIDNGTWMCWDRSRTNRQGEPAIVRVSEGRKEHWGGDLFDFLVNHWLTGWFVHGRKEEIPEKNLNVLALRDP
jgi:hypothetical protein